MRIEDTLAYQMDVLKKNLKRVLLFPFYMVGIMLVALGILLLSLWEFKDPGPYDSEDEF